MLTPAERRALAGRVVQSLNLYPVTLDLAADVAALLVEVDGLAKEVEQKRGELIPGYNRCGYCDSEWVTHAGEYSSHSCPSMTDARERMAAARAASPEGEGT